MSYNLANEGEYEWRKREKKIEKHTAFARTPKNKNMEPQFSNWIKFYLQITYLITHLTNIVD